MSRTTTHEAVFFRRRPRTSAEVSNFRRAASRGYESFSVREELRPFRTSLSELLPTRAKEIQKGGKIVFHALGDTGKRDANGAQEALAFHMGEQVHDQKMPDQPSFLFHLGDIVYTFGEERYYTDEFYKPYAEYPAPIFAVPGNHDGYVGGESHHSLEAFLHHFCDRTPHVSHAAELAQSDRPTMTQPNAYFRLDAPLVTIIGLYSNTTGTLDNPAENGTAQRDWLADQLADAPTGKCLMIAVHHPPYSLGHHGNTTRVQEAIEFAVDRSKRFPDAVLSGHEHNYQRFTRTVKNREIPYVIAGAGGHTNWDIDRVATEVKPPVGVRLAAHNSDAPGFLRISIDRKQMVCEYFTVERARRFDPPALSDQFTLDLDTHKITKDGVNGGG